MFMFITGSYSLQYALFTNKKRIPTPPPGVFGHRLLEVQTEQRAAHREIPIRRIHVQGFPQGPPLKARHKV